MKTTFVNCTKINWGAEEQKCIDGGFHVFVHIPLYYLIAGYFCTRCLMRVEMGEQK